ncbi:OLC1v1010578C1 [Oldenlandia corymbosa var. corymbosa]|uniref:OLC1v1010578C1 n=1 Tax=Oldenlandia corymbosa var. corymbosa TaxID=529605 RepID=A0AAV1DRP1_OLDCO|nr:OLC1v1010578C1 [Oldenlandia corymbosa var. corymbosa]
MNSVVATSSLSKSWRPRWTEVTSFHFGNRWWPDGNGLDCAQFVNKSLRRNNNESSPAIHKFGLQWDSTFASGFNPNMFLTRCLLSAVCRKVRVVDLDAFSVRRGGISIPEELYTCKTLEILKLRGPFEVKAPPPDEEVEVFLPKLVHLELNFVHYYHVSGDEFIHKLIRGCPVLQSLRIERNQYFSDSKDVSWSISSPALECLEIYSHDDGCFKRCETLNFKLEIDAPALKKLVLIDRVAGEISIRGGGLLSID